METVILNGLEWMGENLSGHGGIERDGNWYYTWDQAMKAAEEIGDGWRLPMEEEISEASEYYLCTMHDNGMYLGGHEELYLPALGALDLANSAISNRTEGFYWGNSAYEGESFKPVLHLLPLLDYCEYDDYQYKKQYLSVRFVRNIKK